jgi:hypothetical protein
MSNEDEGSKELAGNPFLMTGISFAMWLSGKGVALIGTPPVNPITRAALLFELVQTGKVNANEIDNYLWEIGLMMPIAEN